MAYAAPNEDTVVVVGGLGTQADKAALNGSGATKAVWDAGSPSDFIDTNGGPKTTTAVATFTTATKVLAAVGIGTGVTVGTLVYVSTGDGSHITPGVYEVTAQANDSITCAQIDDDGTNDTGVTCNVGGALDGLQNALDNDVNDATSFNRYIYTNLAETLTAATDIDTNTGSSATRVVVKGANSSCVVDGTRPVITGNASVASGLLSFTSAVDYTQWWYLDFNAGGANKFDYGIYNANTETTSQFHSFHDCIIREAADETGLYCESSNWQVVGCQIYNNGDGVFSDGSVFGLSGCSIHDNTGEGVKLSAAIALIGNNLIYDNGANGITCDAGTDQSTFKGNTIFGNNTHGLNIDNGADQCKVFNNTSCGNGTGGSGYGYNFVDRDNVQYFAFNHSRDGGGDANDNADGHCNLMTDPTSDSEWADFFEGNNQAGAPNFTNITDGSEDFRPDEDTSDLVDNALDAGTA